MSGSLVLTCSDHRTSPIMRPGSCKNLRVPSPLLFTVIWLTPTRAGKANAHAQETKEVAMDETRSGEHGGHQELLIRATIAFALFIAFAWFYGFIVTVSLLPV